MDLVSYDQIEDLLSFLHDHPSRPQSPIAVGGSFALTPQLLVMLRNPGTFREGLESTAERMAFFLGLPPCIDVRVGIETSDNMSLHPSQLDSVNRAGSTPSEERAARSALPKRTG